MNYNKYLAKIIVILAFLTAGIFTMPALLIFPSPGLDSSWRVSLYLTLLKGLQSGKDVIHAYGPLGFLYLPIYIDFKLWAISFLFALLIHLLFLSSIALLAAKSSATWKEYAFIFIALLVATAHLTYPDVEYKLLLSVLILFYLILTEQITSKYIPLIFLSSNILLSVASLIKFSATSIAISIIFLSGIVFIYKKHFRYLIYMFFIYIVSLSFFWILSGQELTNVPLYFSKSYEVSSGYSTVLSLAGPAWHVYCAIFIIGVLAYLFLVAFRKKRYNLLLFILLSSSFIFLSFKHSFARHDDHVYIFFTNMILLSCFIYISNKKEGNIAFRSLTLLIALVSAIVIYEKYPAVIKPDILEKLSMSKTSLSLFINVKNHKDFMKDTKNEIRKGYPLRQQTLQYLQDRSVDIFPWDFSLVYAYDLNWSPRPTLASYATLSKDLDLLNAQHFKGLDAPDIVLYSYKSIDGRYPIFDEPATFEEMLCSYYTLHKSSEFLVIKKEKENRCGARQIASFSTVNIGEPVKIPDYDKGYMFAEITMEYSWIGKIYGLFYRPSEAHIRFINTNDIGLNRFRFIPELASNGVFLSQYINNMDDLFSLFSGNIDKNNSIREIIIDVDNLWHYKKDVKVKFILIPAEIKIKRVPIWEGLKRVKGGLMFIDAVNDKLYTSIEGDAVINLNKERSLKLRGWAIDDKNKDSGEGAYLVFRGDSKERVIATHKVTRPDVAKYFGEESYSESGWSLFINTDNFKEGCYSVSLRILRKNREEYHEIDGDKPICFKS